MKCKKCGSENVTVTREQIAAKTKTNHTGLLHDLGRLFLVLCTCGLWLLVPRRKANSRTKFKSETICICQDCGNSWRIK